MIVDTRTGEILDLSGLTRRPRYTARDKRYRRQRRTLEERQLRETAAVLASLTVITICASFLI